MKLTFSKPYKSITSFPETELPDFVILTGVNGAGKTHLLEAIEKGFIQIDNIILDNQARPIRLFNWINLVPNDSGASSPYQITQEKQGLWNELFQNISTYRSQLIDTLQPFNRSEKLINTDFRSLINMTEENLIATGSNSDEARQIIQIIQNTVYSGTSNIIANFVRNDPIRHRLISLLQENSNLPLITFEENDFYEHFPKNWIPIDMFQQSFNRLFLEYQMNLLNNRLKAQANSEGDPVIYLSNEEFTKQYGEPPWIFVNAILETAKMDFRINQPAKYYEDRPYEPILTDQKRGIKVKFFDLSSGERILMSFALCLYYAEDRRQLVDYPKVLLFDEIDAPLHPSMTQSLLHTIQEVLINRHGIKVVMTTHSPSTVALAPETSLYVMEKIDGKRLQKTTKDKALAILTTGVPTLSIAYENRRQVFVESEYDVYFYEKIYEKLRDTLIPDISLNFISSGVGGQGNCAQVKEVVNKLYRQGNQTVYGIIDWDLKNDGNERVKVLGKGNRYSIENYILDPLLLTAFLLREKFIERPDVGINGKETYFNLSTFDDTRLQRIADFIVDKVRCYQSLKAEGNKLTCEYISGQIINLPEWFLQIQGHHLEDTLKQIFPKLNRFQKEGELKKEILLKVVDDIPQLLSKDFTSLFQTIQNHTEV